MARATFEQAQVEGGFQFGDPARQGRLRPPRGACGASKPSVSGDKIEISESKQVHVFHQ